MKKTQIYLGVSAFVLAFVGAFATKANRTAVLSAGYTVNGNCQRIASQYLTLNSITSPQIAKTRQRVSTSKSLYTIASSTGLGHTVCGQWWFYNVNN